MRLIGCVALIENAADSNTHNKQAAMREMRWRMAWKLNIARVRLD